MTPAPTSIDTAPPAPPEVAAPDDAPDDAPGLRESTLYLMAAACGTGAANIYYNQPLLGDFAKYFHATENQVGLVATAAQVGYGLGMLFFVPLGDLIERRKVVLTLVYICTLLLVATAASPTLWTLVVLQGLVGVTCMSAQLLIPLAVDLSPPEKRGHTVGVMLAGLLCGLLGARTLGGIVGDHLGWRAMFAMAAGIMLVTGVVLQIVLPRRRPSVSMPYWRLMRSLGDLVRTQPVLRVSSFVSGCSFGAFIAFWTVLSFLMRDHFHRGATEAGLFGLVGLAGAAVAPLAGKLSDRRGPTFTVTLAMLLSIAAFVGMAAWVSIPGLILGVLLLDLGVQSIQVAAQSEVMSLVPEARSRINTVYMVARFIGGAAGSALGTLAYSHGGWTGTCVAAIGALLVGGIYHAWATPNGALRVAVASVGMIKSARQSRP